MNIFKRASLMSVKAKIWVLSALIVVSSLTIGLGGYWAQTQIVGMLNKITKVDISAIKNIMFADMMHDALRAVVYRSSISTNRSARDQAEIRGEISEFSAAFTNALDELNALDLDAKTKAEISDVRPELDAYINECNRVTELFLTGNDTDGLAAIADVQKAFKTLENKMAILSETIQSAAREHADVSQQLAEKMRNINLVIMLIGMLLSVGVAFLIARSITKPFEGDIDELNTLAKQMTATSHQMAATAEETAQQANLVSSGAEQVSMGVHTVATAVEEMGASIREISKNASAAARVATDAVHAAESTGKSMGELNESSIEIGKVVNVITAIAEQTKLLALNATIEAARAGEAGKGFAVVANEVKDLAKETAKATQDISEKIQMIQAAASTSIDKIAGILQVISTINDLQTTIASSVEEQTATTNEVSRNVAEIATGSSEIASNISKVAQAAHDTAEGASETLNVSYQLPKIADHLVTIIAGNKK